MIWQEIIIILCIIIMCFCDTKIELGLYEDD